MSVVVALLLSIRGHEDEHVDIDTELSPVSPYTIPDPAIRANLRTGDVSSHFNCGHTSTIIEFNRRHTSYYSVNLQSSSTTTHPLTTTFHAALSPRCPPSLVHTM
jgi:hypothetical protein